MYYENANSVIEYYKTFGATFGFISAGVAVYEWLFRYRPIAYIEFHAGNNSPTLVVNNPAKYSIFIEKLTCSNTNWVFAESFQAEAIAKAFFRENHFKQVNPNGGIEKFYMIFKTNDGNPINESERNFEVKVKWRRGNNMRIKQIPLLVKSSDSINLRHI